MYNKLCKNSFPLAFASIAVAALLYLQGHSKLRATSPSAR